VLRRVSVCRHAASCTPVDSLGPIARRPASSSRSPGRQRRRPSPGHRWVGVHDKPFGASSDVHLRCGLPARGTAGAVLCVGGFDSFVTSTVAPTATGGSDPVAGWELHPLKTYTFCTAHCVPVPLPVQCAGVECRRRQPIASKATSSRDVVGLLPGRQAEMPEQPDAPRLIGDPTRPRHAGSARSSTTRSTAPLSWWRCPRPRSPGHSAGRNRTRSWLRS
jgi:hypothetical protein